jgi:hypothetical protein
MAVDQLSEWMVTGRDEDGNSQRLVLHARCFRDATEDALMLAHQHWGWDCEIDSVVKQQPEPEYDYEQGCEICGDPRGH